METMADTILDLTIEGGTLLLEGPGRRWNFRSADVGVKNGVIEIIAPDLSAHLASERIDAVGATVTAGFFNGHAHSYSACSAGSAADSPLEELIPRARRQAGSLSEEQQYSSAARHAQIMLKAGVTTVVDQPAQGIANPSPVAEAYRDAGIRAFVAPMVLDQSYENWLPSRVDTSFLPKMGSSTEKILSDVLGFVETWSKSDDLVTPAVGPFAPGMCSDELLAGLAEMSQKYQVPFHTHLAEADWQSGRAKKDGESLVMRLARLGALSARASMAHSIWIDDLDIQVLSESGATVVHNPLSNLMLGSGIAPIPKLLSAGVNIALGSDGLNCGCVADFFQHMRLAVAVHRPNERDWSVWHGAHDALSWATYGGACGVGRGSDLGKIQVGYQADLVVHRPSTQFDVDNDVTSFVYLGSSEHVSDVVVGGRYLVRDGRVESAR